MADERPSSPQEQEGERIIDRNGASLELIRKVKVLQDAFEENRLIGAPKDQYTVFRPTARRETTVLANRGLRLRTVADEESIYFHCVCGACFLGNELGGKIRGSASVRRYTIHATSNVANHLKNAHQIESGKSRQSKLKKMNTSSELQRTDDSFAHDPAQFFENIFVL